MKGWRSYLPLRMRVMRRPPTMPSDLLTHEEAARRDMRKFSRAELEWIVQSKEHLEWFKSIARSEIKRQEAWDTPAAVSVRIAMIALGVSIVSLGISIWNASQPTLQNVPTPSSQAK